MAKKKVKEIEAEIEMQVDEESSMIDLVGVIKSEMDDAKDFIHQVGERELSQLSIILVVSERLLQPYNQNLFLPMLEIQFYLCCLLSCVLFLVLRR